MCEPQLLKDCDLLKADTPSSVDQSPHSGPLGKGRGKGQGRRPRKMKAAPGQVPVNPIGLGPGAIPPVGGQPGMPGMQPVQTTPQMTHMPGGYPQNPASMQQQGQQFAGQQQWYGQQQQAQPQGYYPQQMANGECYFGAVPVVGCEHSRFVLVNRFERPQQINQSKQALSNMLRQRHPLTQFMGPGAQTAAGPGPQASYGAMQRPFPRQPMRQQHPTAMQSNQVLTPAKSFFFPFFLVFYNTLKLKKKL